MLISVILKSSCKGVVKVFAKNIKTLITLKVTLSMNVKTIVTTKNTKMLKSK